MSYIKISIYPEKFVWEGREMTGYGIGKYVGEQKSGHVHVKIHKGTRVLWFRTMCSPDTGIMGFTCNFVPGKLLLRFPS